MAPSFDIVRINPQGKAVIAGRAEPGDEVTVLDGDRTLGKVTANERGEWVLLPNDALPPGSRELSLTARSPKDGTSTNSDSVVVLVVPEATRPGVPPAISGGSSGGTTIAANGPPPTPAPVMPPPATSPPADQAGAVTAAGPTPAVPLAAAPAPAAPAPAAPAPAAPAPAAPAPAPPADGTAIVIAIPPAAVPAPVPGQAGVPASSKSSSPAPTSPARSAGAEVAAQAPTAAAAVAPQPGSQPPSAAEAAPAGSQALAVLVPRTGDAPAKPLQVPGTTPSAAAIRPPAGPRLLIDVIEYSGAGNLTVSGRAEPRARLLVYLDNRPVGRVGAGGEGGWTVKPTEPLPVGRYRLRVDELGGDGKVATRRSLTFERVAAPSDLGEGHLLVVQPGNNLWRIARWSYGSGVRFTEIYAANRADIVDPQLIFPHQIMTLPAAP